MALLDSISSPADLKTLSIADLKKLACEIREKIYSTVLLNGGHLSSNLGVVELSLALHYVFDSPAEPIIWDVGHQSYTHKLVTGRLERFASLRKRGGISGFPKREESPHDIFNTGHASTSISAALGLLEGRKLKGNKDSVVAIIGDGALTAGMAFEALCHAGHSALPLVIVLNDNKMSISPNVGAFSIYLSRLSASRTYQRLRNYLDNAVLSIPIVGERIFAFVNRLKRALKGLFFKENLFSDLGFEYAGPIDGHNFSSLIKVLREARMLRKPVVVHVLTRKGKGFDAPEGDPAYFHGVAPQSCGDGEIAPQPKPMTFTEAFGSALVKRACKDERLVCITAAMSRGTGLEPFRMTFPHRHFDVGIAEQHAVTFAAGLALEGYKPVVAIYSTFAQRALDQLIHDVALQNLPVVLAVDRAGAVSDDGETHQGLYDICATRCLPGVSILAPASAHELDLALNWALDASAPALVRYPKAACPHEEPAFAQPFEAGRGVFVRQVHAESLVISMGSLIVQALAATDILLRHAAKNKNLDESMGADVYNLRFIKPFDEAFFVREVCGYKKILMLEEGCSTGGFCEHLAGIIHQFLPNTMFRAIGLSAQFPTQGTRSEILEHSGLDSASIAATLLEMDAPSRQIFVFNSSTDTA